ncbi:UPF0236 family transposase-like protein, partial [Streptococcus agalactiae]
GVWVKQSSPNKKGKSIELSHFVVHTGSEKGSRNVLKGKFEVISTYCQEARRKLLDVVMNHFEITPETVIVTNSDGGKGYSPAIFSEIAKAFHPKAHLHFWDTFHVHQGIKKHLRPFPSELTELAFEALKNQDRQKLKTVFDTGEALVSDEKLEEFQRFRRQLMKNFRYTEKPEAFGLPSSGIGIMESQHRKITYRMKNRGMYWSKRGADTMSQTILLSYAGKLRELFFGDWRKSYRKMKDQEVKFLGQFWQPQDKIYTIPRLKRQNVKPKYGMDWLEERD